MSSSYILFIFAIITVASCNFQAKPVKELAHLVGIKTPLKGEDSWSYKAFTFYDDSRFSINASALEPGQHDLNFASKHYDHMEFTLFFGKNSGCITKFQRYLGDFCKVEDVYYGTLLIKCKDAQIQKRDLPIDNDPVGAEFAIEHRDTDRFVIPELMRTSVFHTFSILHLTKKKMTSPPACPLDIVFNWQYTGTEQGKLDYIMLFERKEIPEKHREELFISGAPSTTGSTPSTGASTSKLTSTLSTMANASVTNSTSTAAASTRQKRKKTKWTFRRNGLEPPKLSDSSWINFWENAFFINILHKFGINYFFFFSPNICACFMYAQKCDGHKIWPGPFPSSFQLKMEMAASSHVFVKQSNFYTYSLKITFHQHFILSNFINKN